MRRGPDRCDVLGSEISANCPGAGLYGSGNYHLQLARMVWKSRGADERPALMASLDEVEIAAQDAGAITSIAAGAASPLS